MNNFFSSYTSSSASGGIMGGQKRVTCGAVPPYSLGLCDLNIKESNSFGSEVLQKTYLATTDGSKNFYRIFAIVFYIAVKLTTTVLFVFCIQFEDSSFDVALKSLTGNFLIEK